MQVRLAPGNLWPVSADSDWPQVGASLAPTCGNAVSADSDWPQVGTY